MISLDDSRFLIHPEVRVALDQNKPVVALESTVITHGLPYPENVNLARDLEEEIRVSGSIPATIAIIEGRICVGIGASQLDQLVRSETPVKISVRDIAPAIQAGNTGGTTVAGTLAIAQAVGIKVFATGGIGGVHIGSQFDVSADLYQLSKSPLVVVCAGAKAILDIPATLEVLETYGVPVVCYQTGEFPAFYSTSSGFQISTRVDTAEKAAELAKTHWGMGFSSAILLAVPPPAEFALDPGFIGPAIKAALAEAEANHVHGQAVTPFLLSRVSELTGGKSLKVNLALLHNNARIASQVARFISL